MEKSDETNEGATMKKLQTPSEQITEEVTSWPGVTAGPGDRGELSFKLGRREIGHLHGDHALHIGFPKEVWAQLYEQRRIDYHPVFPGKPGYAARRIEDGEDVRDAIELLRLNYDRAVARHGLPATGWEQPLRGLHASPPEMLPFAPSLEIRSFLLQREAGNVLIYSVTGLDSGAEPIAGLGGIERQYLNHGHEAMFASAGVDAPLFVHEADSASVSETLAVRATFSRRHVLDDDLEVIPTPGHTPGATALLWDSGADRVLFTGDTIYLDEGEWVAAVLEGSSDRAAYLESLELIRELDFDVLAPWAARGGSYLARVDRAEAQRRIDAIIARVRAGESR